MVAHLAEGERKWGGCIITFFTLPSPRGFFGWVSAGDSTLTFLAAGSSSSMVHAHAITLEGVANAHGEAEALQE